MAPAACLGGGKRLPWRAQSYKKEKDRLINTPDEVKVELREEDGHMVLETNIYDLVKDFDVSLITSDVLGKAFEPE